MTNKNNTINYDIFSKGLLDEIEQKAVQFPLLGLVDVEIQSSVDEKILNIKTSDLLIANQSLQEIDLEEIRWYINMNSLSSNTMPFARNLEHLYRSAGFEPTTYIEYVAYYDDNRITLKKEEGFLVTTFSRTLEKYFRKTVLSGPHAISLYLFLLTLTRLHPRQLAAIVSVDFDKDTFIEEMGRKAENTNISRLTQKEKERQYTQSKHLNLLKLPHLTVIYTAL